MFAFLKQFDMYGRAIHVSYEGEDSYKSRLGAFATIVTYVFGLINLINLSIQYVDKSGQKELLRNIKVDSLDIKQ